MYMYVCVPCILVNKSHLTIGLCEAIFNRLSNSHRTQGVGG